MPSPLTLAYWEGLIVVGGLSGVIFWGMFTGAVNVKYLLYGDQLDANTGHVTSFVSPARTQLLLFTIYVAGYLLTQVIHDPTALPQVPTSMLVGLGGSHAIYLGGKAQSMMLGPLRDFFGRAQQ